MGYAGAIWRLLQTPGYYSVDKDNKASNSTSNDSKIFTIKYKVYGYILALLCYNK